MSPRRPKNIIAVTPGGNITADMLLGYITMFTVPDRPVSATKLNRLWISEGLPHELIPHNRAPINAFQVACRSVETRKRGESGPGKRTEINVDPVMETPDKYVYQVTSLVRDKANEIIDHPKALKVTFDKVSGDIEWTPLDQLFDETQADEIGQQIKDHYDANAKKVPAARVREAIRKLMDHLDGMNLRKKAGGVYFVPANGKSDLDSLQVVLSELWSGDAEVNLIPGINGDDTRNMVERHFDMNVSSEIDEIMAEVTEALTRTDRSVRMDWIGNKLARRKVLADRRETYGAMLDSELSEVEAKLGLLDQQLEALVIAKGSD